MAWKASLLCLLNSAPSLGKPATPDISSCLFLSSSSSDFGNSISFVSNVFPVLVNVYIFLNLNDLDESVFLFYYSGAFAGDDGPLCCYFGVTAAEPAADPSSWLGGFDAIMSVVFQTYYLKFKL